MKRSGRQQPFTIEHHIGPDTIQLPHTRERLRAKGSGRRRTVALLDLQQGVANFTKVPGVPGKI